MHIADYLTQAGSLRYVIYEKFTLEISWFTPADGDIETIRKFVDSLPPNYSRENVAEKLGDAPYPIRAAMQYATTWHCQAMLMAHEMKLTPDQKSFAMKAARTKDWALINPGRVQKLSVGEYYMANSSQLYRISKGYETMSSKVLWRVYEENMIATGVDHLPVDVYPTLKAATAAIKDEQ